MDDIHRTLGVFVRPCSLSRLTVVHLTCEFLKQLTNIERMFIPIRDCHRAMANIAYQVMSLTGKRARWLSPPDHP